MQQRLQNAYPRAHAARRAEQLALATGADRLLLLLVAVAQQFGRREHVPRLMLASHADFCVARSKVQHDGVSLNNERRARTSDSCTSRSSGAGARRRGTNWSEVCHAIVDVYVIFVILYRYQLSALL